MHANPSVCCGAEGVWRPGPCPAWQAISHSCRRHLPDPITVKAERLRWRRQPRHNSPSLHAQLPPSHQAAARPRLKPSSETALLLSKVVFGWNARARLMASIEPWRNNISSFLLGNISQSLFLVSGKISPSHKKCIQHKLRFYFVLQFILSLWRGHPMWRLHRDNCRVLQQREGPKHWFVYVTRLEAKRRLFSLQVTCRGEQWQDKICCDR